MSAGRDALLGAIAEELYDLWDDMHQAWRQRLTEGDRFSISCERIANRIIKLSRLAGATPWQQVQVTLLREGVYQRVYREAGIDYEPIDWDRVEQVERMSAERTMRRG